MVSCYVHYTIQYGKYNVLLFISNTYGKVEEYRTPDWTLMISVLNQILNVTFNCYIHIPYARKIMQRNIITNSIFWNICYTIYCTSLYCKFSISF